MTRSPRSSTRATRKSSVVSRSCSAKARSRRMRWVERGALAALLLNGFAHADAPAYGKVETFQPGKKYNCVPTPDHKAWDCSESGKAAESRESGAKSEPAAPPAPATAVAPVGEPAPKSSSLPSYLTNAAASGQ